MQESRRQRATAVIVQDGKVLLIKRVKPGVEYYIFPGGGVDEGESIEQAMIREVMEELTLEVIQHEFLFTLENISVPETITIHKNNRDEHVFRVTEYTGVPEIGGPEKERASDENQYHIEWVSLGDLPKMNNVYPEIVVRSLS